MEAQGICGQGSTRGSIVPVEPAALQAEHGALGPDGTALPGSIRRTVGLVLCEIGVRCPQR